MAEENKTTAEETAEEVKETEAAEDEVTEATPETQAGSEEVEETKEKKLFGKKKKDKKDEKIEELTDRVKRQMAEFENFRKRTEKEKAGMYAVGAKDVIEKILPVVDNFERGLDVAEDKEDPFVQGMEKIYKQFLTALDGMGVKAIEAVGNEFNPDFHLISDQSVSTLNLIIGIVITILVGLILLGGIKRIGSVTEKLVPFMALFYILLALGVVLINFRNIPHVFYSIIYGAFRPRAVTGGVVGSFFLSMKKGVSRGIFSNEAGLGTGSIAHACADTRKPVKQGLFGIFEVFADTIVICTLTALVILCSGTTVTYGQAAGAELTISGFTSVYGSWISVFTAVAMCCFAFSTIIGWGLYGARCIEFLFSSEKVVKPFMVVYSLVAILGATVELGLLWSIAETFNGLMAIPNLIAVFLLSGTVVKMVKEYFATEGK